MKRLIDEYNELGIEPPTAMNCNITHWGVGSSWLRRDEFQEQCYYVEHTEQDRVRDMGLRLARSES